MNKGSSRVSRNATTLELCRGESNREAVDSAPVQGDPPGMAHRTETLEGAPLIRLGSVDGAPVARRFELHATEGADAGRRWWVDGISTIGASRDANLVLNDAAVSGRHLEVEPRAEGLRLRDLGSKNGTYLGSVRIHDAMVDAGAVIRLGRTRLRLEVSDSEVDLAAMQDDSLGPLVGASAPMQRLFRLLRLVSPSDSTVLLLGETGTGKELIAQEVHRRSPRRAGPLVTVDFGAMAPSLIESELFGHVRGAFTGAQGERQGALLSAEGGTLFLDEIGELPLELQPRLLRVLETGTVKRLGEDRTRQVDVRVVAATHRDLEAEVAQGTFRRDLFYRLAVVPVRIPALRERLDDLPALVAHFLQQQGRPDFELAPELLAELKTYAWPGNVRELRNFIERALVGLAPELSTGANAPAGGDPLSPLLHLPFKDAKEQLLEGFTRRYLSELLRRADGNVSEAARVANVNRTHLHDLLKKYGLAAR